MKPPRFLLALAFLVAAGGVHTIGVQEPSPIESQKESRDSKLELQQFVNELNRWSASLSELEKNPAQVGKLRQTIPAQWVVLVGGDTYEVPTDWMRDALARLEQQPEGGRSLRMIEARLAALRHQAETLKAEMGGGSFRAARSTLDEILSRREFRNVREPTWLDRQMAQFWEWIEWLLERTFGRLNLSSSAFHILPWILISTAFILLVVVAVRTFLSSPSRTILDVDVEPRTDSSARAAVRDAVAAAARQDYREAVRWLHRAAIQTLEERGVCDRDQARTPREYLRLIADTAALKPHLVDLTKIFEPIWYGYRPAARSDVQRALINLKGMGCDFVSSLPTDAF